MSGKGRSGKAALLRPKRSRSSRAGLSFPVSRFRNKRRSCFERREVALVRAAILEYLSAEIIELSGTAAKDNKNSRITRRYISLAIASDQELNVVFQDAKVIGGGKPINFFSSLLPSKKKKKSRKKKKPSYKNEEGQAAEAGAPMEIEETEEQGSA